jgi:hypothetical protein
MQGRPGIIGRFLAPVQVIAIAPMIAGIAFIVSPVPIATCELQGQNKEYPETKLFYFHVFPVAQA